MARVDRCGITRTDLQYMRLLFDTNEWPRSTHRFRWSPVNDRWELMHHPSNTVKAYQADGGWVEA